MRLDKFLKVSRLIKRRTVASAMCQAGRISINDKIAKAASEVKAGDTLMIAFGNRTKTVQIVDVPSKILPKYNSPDGASSLYSVLAELYNETGASSSDTLFIDDDKDDHDDRKEETKAPSKHSGVHPQHSNDGGQLDDLFSVLLGEDP